MKRIVLAICITIIGSTTAFAQCPALESQAQSKAAQYSSQIQGASACKANKATLEILKINLWYFSACPSADPGGSVSASIRASMQQTQSVINSVCN